MGNYLVQNPDGSIERIPDTEPIFTGDQVRSAWQFSPDDTVGSAAKKWAQQLGQGATLGLGDELAAIPATLMQALAHPFFGTEIKNPVQNWREMNADVDQAQAESPGKAVAANMAGGLLSALATGPSVGAQAAYGAVSGFGGGDTTGERIGGGILGGALGGAGGWLLPKLGSKVGEWVGSAIKSADDAMPYAVLNAAQEHKAAQTGAIGNLIDPKRYLSVGEKVAAQNMVRKGINPEVLQSAIANQTGAIADDQAVQTLAEAIGDKAFNWATAQGADDAISDVPLSILKGRGDAPIVKGRIDSFLDAITPERSPEKLAEMAIGGAKEIRQAGRSRLNETAGEMYDALGWVGAPTEDLATLGTTPVARSVGNAAFSGVPGGMPDNMSLRDYQQLASALGKVGKSKSFGAESVLADQSAVVSGKMKSELGKIIPGFKEADEAYPLLKREAFGGMGIEEGGAQDMLSSLARTTPDALPSVGKKILESEYAGTVKELVDGVRQIGPKGDDPLRAMARRTIDSAINDKEGMGLVKGILGKGDGKRPALAEIIGEPAVTKLDRQAGREIAMRDFYNKTLSGSRTALNLNELNAEKQLIGGAIDHLMAGGSVASSAAKGVRALLKNNQIDANVRREVAQILFSQGEDAITKARRLMPYVERLQKLDAIAKGLLAGGQGAGVLAGTEAGKLGGKLTRR